MQACPKCDSEMVRGWLPDVMYGGIGVGAWAEGEPRNSFFFGTKDPKKKIPMAAFRCSQCGYVELFAREEFGSEQKRLGPSV